MPINRLFNTTDEVKDIHKGNRAFIIGSARSLNDFDLNKIKDNDIVFALNQSVTALKKCNYFCMTDGANIEANFFEYGVGICDKVVMCGRGFFELKAAIDQYALFENKSYFFNRRYNNHNNVNFDYNDGCLIDGNDVVHVITHLAYVMGCSPIIFVGVDLNYTNHNKYCKPTYFGKEVVWSSNTPSSMLVTQEYGINDFFLNLSFSLWKLIKEQNPNVKIFNSNPQSRLTQYFETITLED